MNCCGVDEVGRGPLAGPVVAAAVVLPATFPVERLRDSKRLTPAAREAIAPVICEQALSWAIGWASHAEIDRINILEASHLAMRRAVARVNLTGAEVVVDGSLLPNLGVDALIPVRSQVRADGNVPAVMAASILAKVARDRWMDAYARIDGRYEFERHHGYPTKRHRMLLERYGPSAIHRTSFAWKPVGAHEPAQERSESRVPP